MKKVYTQSFLSIVLLLCSWTFSAGDSLYTPYAGAVSVYPVSLREIGEKLEIELEITVRHEAMNECQSWAIFPEIATDHRTTVLGLPDVLVQGKRKARQFRRKVKFENTELMANLPAIRFEAATGRDTTFTYKSTIDYELWMDTASLHLRQVLVSCADKEQLFITKGAAMIVPEPYQAFVLNPAVTLRTPEKSEKNRDIEGKAFLDFQVGRSNIITSYRRNPEELAKINTLISRIREDKDFTIRNIVIHGYASPEGSYESNDRLSLARAEALKNYIRDRYSLPDNLFIVRNTAEDWEGLKGMLTDSEIPEKEQILHVINTVDIFEGRESRLMKLDGGRPYRKMLEEMFPDLRRVEYKVEFNVREYSIEESEKLAEMSPDNLNSYELYLLAETREAYSPQWNELIEKNAALYPDDPAAANNFAALLLTRNDLPAAKRYLDRIGEDTDTYNNYGVYYMLSGNPDKAEELLSKAAALGSAEARHNLRQLELQREDLRRAERHALRTGQRPR